MPTATSTDNNAGLAALVFIIAALAQVIRPYLQAQRYEQTTGKPLSDERRIEVRLRMARGVVTLLLFFEVLLNLLISPIGWLTCIGIGLFSLGSSLQLVRAMERRRGVVLDTRGRLRFLAMQWPAYLYIGVALLSWPIPQLLPFPEAHTIVPGVFFFIAGALALAIVVLFTPVGWALLVSGGLAILVLALVRVRRQAPRRPRQRIALLWRGWPGVALLAVALFFWPFGGLKLLAGGGTTSVPEATSTATQGSFPFPFITPSPSPTLVVTGPVSQLLEGAMLGAPQSGFDAKFGYGPHSAGGADPFCNFLIS
jgi:hypothetical protein